LTLGLGQVTAILSNRSKGRFGTKGEHYRGYRGKHDAKAFQKTSDLFDRVYRRRLSSIKVFQEARKSPWLDDMEIGEVEDNVADDGVHLLNLAPGGDNTIVKFVSDVVWR